MKQVIDHLISITDWTINSPSTISENEFQDYIAGLNSKSLLIKFDAADTTKTATKVFTTPFDVTDYDTLVFSVWSKSLGKQIYNKASDFNYKIKINGTDEYYMPIYDTMSDVSIGIEDVTSITQIEITALHTQEDYIVISEMIAEKEEASFDILTSIKEHVDYFIEEEYGDGISIATGVTGTVGNDFIEIGNDPSYIGRYAVIKIVEGANEETHQILDSDGEKFHFNSNYDGKTLLNSFTSATIYITFPCYFNPGQGEVRLPGIAIWGIAPEPKLTDGKLYTKVDTYSVTNDNFKERTIGLMLSYTVLLDLESYNTELIEKMAQVIRKLIARESLWINGRYHYTFFAGAPVEQKPTLGIDIIPKMQYSMTVDIRENIHDRITVPKTSVIDLDIFIND